MITNGEMAEDLALHADGSVHQQRCAGRSETPIDRREFVDHVARLLAEEAGEVDLMPAEKVQAYARRPLGDAEGVIHLRNADEEVGRVDAALRHESRQASTHFRFG